MAERIEGSPGGLNGPGTDWQALKAHKCRLGHGGSMLVKMTCPTCDTDLGEWSLGCVQCFQGAIAYSSAHCVLYHWRQALEKVGVRP